MTYDELGNPTEPEEGIPLWSEMIRYAHPTGPPGFAICQKGRNGRIVASAYDESGRIVSLVVVELETRGESGRTWVGHVVSITRADARRRGHASRLYHLLVKQGVDVLNPAYPDRSPAIAALVRSLRSKPKS